jgi:hypothetical protein
MSRKCQEQTSRSHHVCASRPLQKLTAKPRTETPSAALLSVVGHSSLEVHIGALRTDEYNSVANSTTDGCWREYYARNYEGKRHADKNKNKAVAGKLALGFFVRCLVDVRLVEQ